MALRVLRTRRAPAHLLIGQTTGMQTAARRVPAHRYLSERVRVVSRSGGEASCLWLEAGMSQIPRSDLLLAPQKQDGLGARAPTPALLAARSSAGARWGADAAARRGLVFLDPRSEQPRRSAD
jgi:hypothetical protein